MLLDNENSKFKVYEWINKYTEEGDLDIVTGYFTIGALAYLSKITNEKIEKYRFVIGDIVNVDDAKSRSIDLLNENITVEAALKLNELAKEAVRFLKQDKVQTKTLEPNFCHAKAILQHCKNDDRFHFFISGSSNLTEAGIGLKETNNVELNIGETGDNGQYKELIKWFDGLWKKEQAHNEKTIETEDGKTKKIPFKKYLISEIERIFIEYSPRDIYYKILFELFGEQMMLEQDDPEFNRQIGRLENSVVYQTLYTFQQKGVLSLIKMLQKYNGAILADAVGLGKTWSALAVMKFFELEGREIILLCPKKLQHNWAQYKKHHDSRFEKDQFDYFIRFHTDMKMELMDKDQYRLEREDTLFVNSKPKLFVIDESHNLRNDKSNRYQFFLEEILKKNEDAKILMLSATPINNNLNDIRNQYKLMVAGDNHGFYESLNIRNLNYTFKDAQKTFNEWRKAENPKISQFIQDLPDTFFKLTDSLTVARTRKMIEGLKDGLEFPSQAKPENLFVTPKEIGNFETFEELYQKFPPMLSGYQPAFYAEPFEEKKKRMEEKAKGKKSATSILDDEVQRDRFLVKMMYILLVKRLESSWFSFFNTAKNILAHHQNALDKIKAYEQGKKNAKLNNNQLADLYDDESEEDFEELTLGKKRIITLKEIDEAGNLSRYKKDLKKDIDALRNIISNLDDFNDKIEAEKKIPNNHKSKDIKLETLINRIHEKRASGNNNNNQKLVIFTVYRDTAEYLFEQLKDRGFDKLAMVSGTGSKIAGQTEEFKRFEHILERFAPYTKLYRGKVWSFQSSKDHLPAMDEFAEWISWVSENDQKTYQKLQNPIDILIATDALSEGQNMQDADMVVNYDIHWNPVRIVQRMGRIDRLGSPNETIYGINFWPSDNINNYLYLKDRIEQRMAAMKLAGAEVNLEFSDSFKEMAEDQNLEDRNKRKMLEQMETNLDDIEVSEQNLGFDDLSLEKYRQDLLEEFNNNSEKYRRMPNAVYTGFNAKQDCCPENGIIALLGYPTRPAKTKDHQYQHHDLVYINQKGENVLLNQKEVLDALTQHKDEPRFVPEKIDKGDETEIAKLQNALNNWLKSQAFEVKKQDDGSKKQTIGLETKKMLDKLKHGDKDALETAKKGEKIEDKYKAENFDLIAWFVVSN